MIIDVHTHPHRGRETWPLFMDECRHNGIALAIASCLSLDGSLERYPSGEAVRAYNALAEEYCAQAGGGARWLAYLNPQNDNSLDELELCLARGAVGVKLWVSIRRNGSGPDKCYPILQAAGQRQFPVLIHTWYKTDGNGEGEINVWEFAELARRFPGAPLIAAHAGGNWPYLRGALMGLPSAFVDLSGFFPESGQVEGVVREIGADHVVFGSDMLGRSVTAQLTKVYFADISDEDKELILWRNMARLLKLAPSDRPAGTMPLTPPVERNPVLQSDDIDHFCFCGERSLLDHRCPSPVELDGILETHGIAKAFAASSDSIHAKDLYPVNSAFRDSARGCRRVVPLATLDPSVPSWPCVLEGAQKDFEGGGVFPYFHNWRLDSPSVLPFFEECAERRFPLWVNCRTGDHRTRHRGLACRPVGRDELVQFGEAAPENRYVFQGLGVKEIDALLSRKDDGRDVLFEISRLTDYTGHLEQILEKHGRDKLVFGSEFPLRDMRTVRWTAQRRCERLKA